jgi:hypothetical protein
MADTNGTNGLDITAFAKIGAELEYANMLRRQASMKRMFPGIDKKALLRIQREQAAHARSAKGTRRHKRVPKAEAEATPAADRG